MPPPKGGKRRRHKKNIEEVWKRGAPLVIGQDLLLLTIITISLPGGYTIPGNFLQLPKVTETGRSPYIGGKVRPKIEVFPIFPMIGLPGKFPVK